MLGYISYRCPTSNSDSKFIGPASFSFLLCWEGIEGQNANTNDENPCILAGYQVEKRILQTTRVAAKMFEIPARRSIFPRREVGE